MQRRNASVSTQGGGFLFHTLQGSVYYCSITTKVPNGPVLCFHLDKYALSLRGSSSTRSCVLSPMVPSARNWWSHSLKEGKLQKKTRGSGSGHSPVTTMWPEHMTSWSQTGFCSQTAVVFWWNTWLVRCSPSCRLSARLEKVYRLHPLNL